MVSKGGRFIYISTFGLGLMFFGRFVSKK